MAVKRSDAARDYKAKIALESRFKEAYRPVERRLVKDVIREVARSETLPDVKLATRKLAEPVLLKHYRTTAKEFSGRIRERLPDDVRSTEREDEEIAAALGVLLLARSKRQAEFIGTSNQNDATDSLRIARAERDRRASAGEGLMGATELALTAGALFDSRLKGRTAGIALVETEAVAEVSKLTETEYLLGSFDSEGAPTKKTGAMKEWVSQGDQRVRPAHLAADGEQVPVNEPFLVGGERLMHPGDTSLGASMSNIANCRCSAVYDAAAIVEARREQQRLEGAEIEVEEPAARTPMVRAPIGDAPDTGIQTAIRAQTAAGGPSAAGVAKPSDLDRARMYDWVSRGRVSDPVHRQIEMSLRDFNERIALDEIYQNSRSGLVESWTLDANRIAGYGSGQGDVVVRLHVSGGLPGRRISQWSLYAEEQEVFAPLGAKYKIVDVKKQLVDGPSGAKVWNKVVDVELRFDELPPPPRFVVDELSTRKSLPLGAPVEVKRAIMEA